MGQLSLTDLVAPLHPGICCHGVCRSHVRAAAMCRRRIWQKRKVQMGCYPDQATQESAWDLWETSGQGNMSNHRDDVHVVLVHPTIPPNTGNIARTCAATRVSLHLIEPIGFETSSSRLRRAGLDFWPYVVANKHKSWEEFTTFFGELQEPKRLVAFTKFATVGHMEPEFHYRKGDWLVFGSETTGLPEEAHKFIEASGGHRVKIPMEEEYVRCLNLSVSVGIGLYEALRQLDFPRESHASTAM